VFDSLPEETFDHPAYLALHAAIRDAGGVAAGLGGAAWMEAVAAKISTASVRSLLTELSVEPLKSTSSEDARYVASVLSSLQEVWVGKQVAELKSKLQRISPAEDPEEYHALFGDLVALEQYRRGLREQTDGAQGVG
jgi:DNA primase